MAHFGLADQEAEAWWGCNNKCSLKIRYETESGSFVEEDCCDVTCPPAGQTSASCAECTCDYNDLDSGACLKLKNSEGGYYGSCSCKCVE